MSLRKDQALLEKAFNKIGFGSEVFKKKLEHQTAFKKISHKRQTGEFSFFKRNIKKLKKIKSPKRKYLNLKQGERPKYAEYILSKNWLRRRLKYYRKFGKVCQACGSKKKINLHHKSYKHLGHERNRELVALCEPCHAEYHEKYGVQRKMIKSTEEFIQLKRAELEFEAQDSHIRALKTSVHNSIS